MSATPAAWGPQLPDRQVLRREVEAMAAAIHDVVLRELGADAVRGLYHKGSGHKPWDTPIDYVPELSDVDVHLWLRDEAAAGLGGLERGLRVQSAIEFAFTRAAPAPAHVPRPQIMILNELQRQAGYVPSPPATVQVLHGEPYPADGGPTEAEIRAGDRERLLSGWQELSGFGLTALDRPGPYVWEAVRRIGWRVSPVGPRVLTLLGEPPGPSWAMNRTGVTARLAALGQHELAAAIRAYCMTGWQAFLEGFARPDTARALLQQGFGVLRLGREAAAAVD